MVGALLATLDVHVVGVESAAFSPDGQRVVTASRTGSVRVWSVEGAPLDTLDGSGFGVRCASFSPDGERVATVSENGTGRIWPISDRLLKAHLESATRICLGIEERRAYLDETDDEAQTAFEQCQFALGRRFE